MSANGTSCQPAGRARQLGPGNSDVDPLCNIEGIVDLNAEVVLSMRRYPSKSSGILGAILVFGHQSMGG